jgi:hypothetical protein
VCSFWCFLVSFGGAGGGTGAPAPTYMLSLACAFKNLKYLSETGCAFLRLRELCSYVRHTCFEIVLDLLDLLICSHLEWG